jgi:spermidine synthase
MGIASAAVVPAQTNKPEQSAFRYYALFFTSGFPALLYQIVWQRALFTIYGVNIQSVTVIVTVFMMGLGLGSLAGGKISTLPNVNVLRIFGFIEASIGLFGAFSLVLFHSVERFTAGASVTSTAIFSFLLLLIPTLLMGSTLPLLVEHLVRRTDNVGESVGSLYCVNTLGSAVACFLASMFLMRLLGESGTVRLAAAMNLLVGAIAILLAFREAHPHHAPTMNSSADQAVAHKTMSLLVGMMLVGAAGFIALAYEILWYHIYSYTSGNKASCFARLLGCYLVGIAYGSLAVHDECKKRLRNDLPRTIRGASIVVCLGAIVAFLVVPVAALCVSMTKIPYDMTFVFVSIAAALLGAAFPIISHASIDPNGQAGKELSYLYLSNIIGSALGSFTIGFIVMDHLSTANISLLLLLLGLLMAAVLAALARPLPIKGVLFGGVTAGILLAIASHSLFSGLFERLMYRLDYRSDTAFRDVVENRSGVITVDQDETVYGGGMYDGEFRIDPLSDRNNIFRAFAIAAIHPNPRRVLVIGLSSGSWTQVLVNHPEVEDTEIVEINPGYLHLIESRPIVSSLLTNPKVHIEIDDGRRWLVAHPDARFDFILMNTTFNWRANTTNLLSVEFLQLARKHLSPGGILYYNTTGSQRVQFTGAMVFPHALRISNFMALSDSPLRFDRANWKRVLENYQIDGRRVFNLSDPDHRACIERWVSMPESQEKTVPGHLDASIEYRASLLRRFQGQRVITDDNMGTEWW